jgi:hypothetical protein
MGKVTFDDLVTIKERFMEVQFAVFCKCCHHQVLFSPESVSQLDLDASGIVELSELSDTGGNMPSQEKIDEVSMNTAIQYVTEKGDISAFETTLEALKSVPLSSSGGAF